MCCVSVPFVGRRLLATLSASVKSCFAFRGYSSVALLLHPCLQASSHLLDSCLLLWRVCQIGHFPWIGLEIVKLFGGPFQVTTDEFCGHRILFCFAFPGSPEGLLILFSNDIVERRLGVQVANVFVTTVANRADRIVGARDNASRCVNAEDPIVVFAGCAAEYLAKTAAVKPAASVAGAHETGVDL